MVECLSPYKILNNYLIPQSKKAKFVSADDKNRVMDDTNPSTSENSSSSPGILPQY